MTRISTSLLLSFVALAIVALALTVNWMKAGARTPATARARDAHSHA